MSKHASPASFMNFRTVLKLTSQTREIARSDIPLDHQGQHLDALGCGEPVSY